MLKNCKELKAWSTNTRILEPFLPVIWEKLLKYNIAAFYGGRTPIYPFKEVV